MEYALKAIIAGEFQKKIKMTCGDVTEAYKICAEKIMSCTFSVEELLILITAIDKKNFIEKDTIRKDVLTIMQYLLYL